MARDLGVHPGTLGNWVQAERRRSAGGGLSADERGLCWCACAPRTPSWAWSRCAQVIRGRLGQGGDKVSVAALIAAYRTQLGIPHA